MVIILIMDKIRVRLENRMKMNQLEPKGESFGDNGVRALHFTLFLFNQES